MNAEKIKVPDILPDGLDRSLVHQKCDEASGDNPTKRMLARAWLEEQGVFPDGAFYPTVPDTAKGDPSSTVTTSTDQTGESNRNGPACGKAMLTKISDVDRLDVEWLWPGRFPIGMLSLIFGDGGVGKSQLTLKIAAHVTKGTPWPDLPDVGVPAGKVILIQSEDSIAHTVRPRVDASGADASKVICLTGVKQFNGAESTFSMGTHAEALLDAVRRVKDVRLVIIDPVSAFLGPADECKNGEVRLALMPIVAIAEAYRFAVILVHHVNKGTGTKAMYRASGSLAFVNASRVAWFASKDPDEEGRCYLAPVKANICATPTAMAFRTGEGSIVFEADPVDGMDANKILARERQILFEDDGMAHTNGRVPKKLEACIEWLKGYLRDGRQLRAHAYKAADVHGISCGTFYDAIRRGPFVSRRFDGLECLMLKDEEAPPDSTPLAGDAQG